MQVLTTASEHDPKPVWELLKGMGVGPHAIAWSRPFGTDLRRFWGACEHGELMVGISVQALVPSMLTTLAMLECVESSMHEDPPPEVSAMLREVNGWLTDGADEGDVSEAIGGLDVAIAHFAQEQDTVNLRASQATHALGLSIMHAEHICPHQRQASVAAMRQATELRIETVRAAGETSDNVLRGVGLSTLREFANVVRNYIPIEVVTMSSFGHATCETTVPGEA